VLVAVVRFVGPSEGFYETALTVSAALYIAMAVELRLFRPRKFVLPEDPKKRAALVREAVMLLVYPVLSIAGLFTGLVALYQGGTKMLGALTAFGFAATAVSFATLSLRVFFVIFGQAIPWSEVTKRRIALAIGAVFTAVGIFLFVAYRSQA
jgi:hypothetical protein